MATSEYDDVSNDPIEILLSTSQDERMRRFRVPKEWKLSQSTSSILTRLVSFSSRYPIRIVPGLDSFGSQRLNFCDFAFSYWLFDTKVGEVFVPSSKCFFPDRLANAFALGVSSRVWQNSFSFTQEGSDQVSSISNYRLLCQRTSID